ILLEIGQLNRWGAQLDVVDEERFAAYGEAGLQIARPGLVDGKSAMRIAAAGKVFFRQWNQRELRRPEWFFYTDTRRPRQHPFFVGRHLSSIQSMVRGILKEQA